jgi:hypothetical protein
MQAQLHCARGVEMRAVGDLEPLCSLRAVDSRGRTGLKSAQNRVQVRRRDFSDAPGRRPS